MNELELIEKLSITAIDTAMKIAGDNRSKSSEYIDALSENWSELVDSVRIIHTDYYDAVDAFGHNSEWTKTMFTATYQCEAIRVARIIIKSMNKEDNV